MQYCLSIALLASLAARASAVGVGAACSTTTTCTVAQSYCRYLFTSASCSNGACTCNSGYSGNTCAATITLKGYDEACTANSDCASGYTCTTNKCKCDPSTNTYRSALDMCLAPAVKSIGETCTQTSDCYNTGGATNGMTCQTVGSAKQCACATGYLQEAGLCVKPYYGQTCTSSVGCRQRTVMFANSDSSRQTEVCPANGGTCGCPTTADSVPITYAGMTYVVCLQKTTATLLADGATCTASNLCASKLCNTCMDGTSGLKCVRLVNGGGKRLATPIALLVAIVALSMTFF